MQTLNQFPKTFFLALCILFNYCQTQTGLTQYFGNTIDESTRSDTNPTPVVSAVVTLFSLTEEEFIYTAVSDHNGLFIFEINITEGGQLYNQRISGSGYEREITMINATRDNGMTWGLNRKSDSENTILLIVLLCIIACLCLCSCFLSFLSCIFYEGKLIERIPENGTKSDQEQSNEIYSGDQV